MVLVHSVNRFWSRGLQSNLSRMTITGVQVYHTFFFVLYVGVDPSDSGILTHRADP